MEARYLAKLLSMAESAYNIAKNAKTSHILFELNYSYHPRVFFKEDVKSPLRSCSINELAKKLRKLMEVGCQNLFHA